MDLQNLLEAVCAISGHHSEHGPAEATGVFVTPLHILTSYYALASFQPDSLCFENMHGVSAKLDGQNAIVSDKAHDLAIARLDQLIGRKTVRPPMASPGFSFVAPSLTILTRMNDLGETIPAKRTGETLMGEDVDPPLQLDHFWAQGELCPPHYGAPIVDFNGAVTSVLSGYTEQKGESVWRCLGAPEEAVRGLLRQALDLR